VRIISGSARGTKLQSLPIDSLRPMLDRVKEALFNIIHEQVPGTRVLDLFSGSGALGLEALSRGSEFCTFVEKDRRLAGLVRRNVAKCRFEDRSDLLQLDVFVLARRSPGVQAGPADLVFADAPYAIIDDPNERGRLFRLFDRLVGRWIAPGGSLILHHGPMPFAVWPGEILTQTDKRIYGNSQLTFFSAGGHGDA
jgi:16S rRNA (guanine(966)-N(2))-methyltransferase RsmD